ncbi:MAG: glycoside hydrolase family 3 C-terminal domain-containing protein [Paludibacter sp.]|nr:glycoside hydrolase family 3 C-terminal domain-containing protein [Paludibacter sp.]
MRKFIVLSSFLFIVSMLSFSQKQQAQLPYQKTELSFEQRTEDLLSRLTLQEKVDLMRYDSPAIPRMGIPAYNWWNECLHGVARSGLATVFPQAIGMAAMWDGNEMSSIANAISDEARAKYHDYISRDKRGIYQGLTYWTPNINIFRDPRWGRGMETYGEDPYLTGELAVPFVKGLQGDDPKYFKLVATAKHFAVHSGPESTRHSADIWPTDRDMAETYTPHFKKVVKDAQVYSVMCAYQRLKGAPCCGNKFLESMLRDKWGFKGYIVSDCWAVVDFFDKKAHHVVNTREEAAAMAVKAGTDLNCGSSYPALVKAVKKGLITEAELNVSVRRVIMARMKLGMFDPDENVKFAQIPFSVVDSKEHQELALDAARKSLVLLKNANNLLPLSKNLKKVAVIGPNADDLEVLLANYNGYPSSPKTPLAGIREKLPNSEVVFAQGCELAAKLPYFQAVPSNVLYTDESMTQHGLKANYFDNPNWKGKPKHSRVDANVDFIWRTTAPFADMKYDAFSANWSGVLVPTISGEYALGAEGLSGFNLYIDGKLVTKWKDVHHPRKMYELFNLVAGKKYKIRLEYLQHNTDYSIMRLLWSMPKPNLKQEAVELAKSSDAVILCMGLSPLLEGEEMKVKVDGFSGGDRLDIQLPATQSELIKEIYKLGKPTVLVLLNGSALAFNWEAEYVPAILEAWYPGQAGGTAIADVLFGDYNPSGRLPLTFYKSIDQIPAFDDYNMTGKTYRYFKKDPLYEFGYGLSYSTFEYETIQAPAEIKAGETLELTVNVKNTSNVDGDEIVQLYVSLPDSKFPVPIRSLQGFNRIHLKAGETKPVRFSITPDKMAAFDDNSVAQVRAGRVLVSVGGKQPDNASIENKKVASKTIQVTGDTFNVPE